jgi:acetyl-CoA acetyltransferase
VSSGVLAHALAGRAIDDGRNVEANIVPMQLGEGLEPGADSVVLACASSVTAAIAAGSMLEEGVRDLAIVGGVESLSRVQIGLNQKLSDWLRQRRTFVPGIGSKSERLCITE